MTAEERLRILTFLKADFPDEGTDRLEFQLDSSLKKFATALNRRIDDVPDVFDEPAYQLTKAYFGEKSAVMSDVRIVRSVSDNGQSITYADPQKEMSYFDTWISYGSLIAHHRKVRWF